METPLLRTKLYVPPPRPDLVARLRLVARLDEGLRLGHRLTLVSAPAGFGKTTLLSTWAAGCERPVAWLSLDESDNDPSRFLTYVVAALQQIEPNLGQAIPDALQSPQRPPIEALLTLLINQLSTLSDLLLVLDDYHLITARSIHDALAFLLDHLPDNAHLVIASRADPPLPLARLRGRGRLTELRQADLRFTADEAATFLERVSGLDLSPEEIAALEERTEGWITGLQLAAISMRDRKDVSHFVSAFAGSHRYVLDYLAEEVLQKEPPEIQTFLLQTAILDRLTAPLCDAVRFGESAPLDRGRSQAILAYLEQVNLFVVPLDDRRIWYRYHRLFADLLRARLEDRTPDLVPVLHRRASAWYEGEGLLDSGMDHALAAGDMARAGRLVETHGRSLLMRGELTTLLRWLAALPEEMIEASARLCVTYGWTLLLTGQSEGIGPRLQRAEEMLAEIPQDPLLGDIAVIRAYRAAQRGDVARTIELANLALERLPSDRQGERGVAYFVLGGARVLTGDWTGAAEALAQAAAVGAGGKNPHIAVSALNSLASIQAEQGHLHQAQATAEEAVKMVTGADGQPRPIAAGAISALAELAYERNELDAALDYARQSVELGRLWGNSDTLGFAGLTLVDILAALGRVEEAREALCDAEQLSRQAALLPTFFPKLRATRARLWLAEGDLAAVATWAQSATWDPSDPLHAEESMVLARVRLALGDTDSALEVLTPLLEMARSQGMVAWLVEGLALRAVAQSVHSDSSLALVTLAEALALAGPEGFVRRFVDLGPAMASLLRQAVSQGVEPNTARDLLAAMDADGEGPSLPQPLIEPLSSREIEVLALVAQGLSNREVGQQLHIAESTVKSHLNTIYGKLGVENRTQAAAKARALNLLP